MSEGSKIRADVAKMFDVAQKANAEAEGEVVPKEFATKEETEKTLTKLGDKIETTKNQGENILSRLRAGVISRDVAKKQMKNLLMNQCSELLGITMRYKGIAPDLKVSEDQIKEAMSKVSQQLS
mgnify:CR=1 FL=1